MLAPLTWSFTVILFKQSGDASALSLNLFKNVVGMTLLVFTMVLGGIAYPTDRSAGDWVRLAVSGLLGLAVADTLLFEGLRRVGASRLAIIDTVYAPLVVLLSWVVLGEVLAGSFLWGAAAVVTGVVMASVRIGTPVAVEAGGQPVGSAARERLIGTLCCLGAICGTAVGVIIAKPALEGANLVELTLTRLAAGVIGQLLWILATGQAALALSTFRPSPLWRTLVPGSILGPYVSLMLWLGGFKWANASVAAVLNQMATVYILVLARVVLKERLRPAQVIGACVAAGGALWIVVGR